MSDVDARPLVLSGRWVHLEPVTPAHYGYLFELFTDPGVLHSWNFRGRVPSTEDFPGLLWDRVLTQFMVVSAGTEEPLGLVSLYSPDFKNRFAKVSLILHESARSAGWSLEGAALIVEYAFQNWDFRKLFLEVLEFNVMAMGLNRLPDTIVEEGRYREFEYYDNRYWDLVVYGVSREAWSGRPLLPDLARPTS
jgi:RimJ/RimL family protein N-acetyltransferase